MWLALTWHKVIGARVRPLRLEQAENEKKEDPFDSMEGSGSQIERSQAKAESISRTMAGQIRRVGLAKVSAFLDS